MRKVKNILGFTMIELLVVISIIGILASIALVSYTSSQKQARDSERKSDIKQYQNAVEIFANQNDGLFPSRPVAAGVQASDELCTDLSLTACPEDFQNANDSSVYYRYQSDGSVSNGSATASQYVLWAELESPSTTTYFVVCSNGKAGQATLGLPPTGGACPI